MSKGKTGAKKVVSRVRTVAPEVLPFQMTWEQVGLTADGRPRYKLRTNVRLTMRPVGKVWRSDTKGKREMAQRAAGRMKGKFVENDEKKDTGIVPIGEERVIESVE